MFAIKILDHDKEIAFSRNSSNFLIKFNKIILNVL